MWKRILKVIKRVFSGKRRGELTVDVLYEWAERHRELFYGFGKPVAGIWHVGAGWEELGFFPAVLWRLLRDMGYQPEVVLKKWARQGVIRRRKRLIKGQERWVILIEGKGGK